MPASRGPVRNVVEACAAVLTLGPLLALPPRWAMAGLAAVGDLLFVLMRGRRAHARRRETFKCRVSRRPHDQVQRRVPPAIVFVYLFVGLLICLFVCLLV